MQVLEWRRVADHLTQGASVSPALLA
jgi:hypothetical protein